MMARRIPDWIGHRATAGCVPVFGWHGFALREYGPEMRKPVSDRHAIRVI